MLLIGFETQIDLYATPYYQLVRRLEASLLERIQIITSLLWHSTFQFLFSVSLIASADSPASDSLIERVSMSATFRILNSEFCISNSRFPLEFIIHSPRPESRSFEFSRHWQTTQWQCIIKSPTRTRRSLVELNGN